MARGGRSRGLMPSLVAVALVLALGWCNARAQQRPQVLGRVGQFQRQEAEQLRGDGGAEPGGSVPASRGSEAAEGAEDGAGAGAAATSSRDYCITPAYPTEGPQSDWNNVKWIAPPARCTVQGFPIEDLQAAFNFRRGWALGFTADVEDKTHLLPYLRASRDLSLHTRRRRVLLDLGGSTFRSSTLWMLRMYPLAFSEIYAFEMMHDVFRIPEKNDRAFDDILSSINDESKVTSEDRSYLPNRILNRIQLFENAVGAVDRPAAGRFPATMNITRFVLDELRLTADDTVIVKMDIEGQEWNVLPAWMKIPGMSDIVDEIFVEIHYSDKTMSKFQWDRFGANRDDAVKLLEDMRAAGFFIHPWP